MSDPTTARALKPLRAALMSQAKAHADRIRMAAEEDGRQVLAAAREEADALLESARVEGRADAAALLELETARARRAAREVVLAAQQAAYERMCEQARETVRALLDEPARRSDLVAVIRDRLGNRATVRDLPDGGVMAESPDGRSIDASVTALVDRALRGVHPERLWTTE